MKKWIKPGVQLAILLTFLAFAASTFAKENKPNIIYIMLDDAGYGDLNTDESRTVKTPSFARMAREGMIFHNHYSGSAVCAPTRCVLMTGKHSGNCRRRDNTAKAYQKELGKRPLVFLRDEDVTIAEMLKGAGYKTCGIGKWGLGNPGSPGVPEKQGFDRWYGYLDQVHAHNHYTDYLWDGGKRIDLPGNKDGKKETYVHDLFEKETLNYIRENKDGPFFLYLAYTLPHGKYVIPENDVASRHYKNLDLPSQAKSFAAMVTRADQTVGKILDLLSELNIDDNTVVFYTSDNGPNQPFVKPLDSAGGLRGIKRKLYEGGIRAKLVVRWPKKIAANSESKFICDMRDFFSTACELAGAQPEANDGVSMVPALLGKEFPERKALYWEIHSPFHQAVRMGNWKAVRWGTENSIELYDLAKDPGEKNDVSKGYPKVIAEVKKVLDNSRSENKYWPAKPRTKVKKRSPNSKK